MDADAACSILNTEMSGLGETNLDVFKEAGHPLVLCTSLQLLHSLQGHSACFVVHCILWEGADGMYVLHAGICIDERKQR